MLGFVAFGDQELEGKIEQKIIRHDDELGALGQPFGNRRDERFVERLRRGQGEVR